MDKNVKETKKDIFYFINNLYHKKYKYPEDNELSSNLWMINRFLSMDKDLLGVVAEISEYLFTLQERYYRLLYRIVPKSNSPFNKYLKPKKEFDGELLSRYSKMFQIGLGEAAEYIRIMRKSMSNKEIFEYVGINYE